MLKISLSQLALSTISLTCFFTYPVSAQVIPDNSLGSEKSIVTPDVTVKDTLADLIEGGAIRGDNLFHSFSEFNVNDGAAVYFANPNDITNILTRVTGNNLSEIFGTVGVDGAANLFLLNPNGIVFGENAALDVSGSFLATTADSYVFENGFDYSASNPNTPPLLTINLPLGVQFGTKAEAIVNQSELVGLEAPPENNLTFIGGDVSFEGGKATAPNGNIEIGSVAPNSLVKIIPTENNWKLDYTEVNSFHDLNLTQAASIDTSGEGGGNIQIQGKQITIQDSSTISANSYGEDNAGILRINATEKLDVFGTNEEDFSRSGLYADVFSSGEGNDIEITTQQLSIREGGVIRAEVFDTGNGGNISLEAENIAATTITFPFSRISTRVNEEATGQGGNVDIKGNELLIENSVLASDSFGEGDSGLIQIDVDQLRVTEGGFITTATIGSGKGGDIFLTAREIEISGVDADDFPSTLSTITYGINQGGNIIINADKLLVADDAIIDASTLNVGNSGDIEINVRQLTLRNDASQIATATAGEGDGGNLIIRASESVEISGKGLHPNRYGEMSPVFSGLFAVVDLGVTGKGGNLIVETGNLSLADGGAITASTFGEGNAGNISIRANNLEVKDTFVNSLGLRSGINNAVTFEGIGDGGNVDIIANNLSLIDGGSITVDSLGEGNAGNMNIQSQNINITGVSSGEPIGDIEQESLPSNISAFSSGGFAAGSININSNNLNLSNQGNISVSNLGNGNSGNLNITAAELNLDNSATIEAKVNAGNQGNINLTTDNIFLRNNSEITVTATGAATGGNIAINNTDNIVLLDNSQIIADAIQGNGGNINITTQGLFVAPDSLISASSELGLDGNVEIEEINGDRKFELNQLSDKISDLSDLITLTCLADENNAFAAIGNGGIPNSPYSTQSLNTTWYDLRPVKQETDRVASLPAPLTEATTTMIDADGELELVALTPLSTHRWINSSCSNSS